MRSAFCHLHRDICILFATRFLRLFAYGAVSVVLVLYLSALGLSESAIGLVLTFLLLGDTAISLWLTAVADRFGRRRILVAGAALMVLAGVMLAVTDSLPFLLIAATIGVLSPSGNEVGPFLAVEQASLVERVSDRHRTHLLGWYNFVGFVATALGSLCGGGLAQIGSQYAESQTEAYRWVILTYSGFGGVLAILFSCLSGSIEAPSPWAVPVAGFGLHGSHRIVAKLSALFALDAFGGGFVIQSFLVYWFHVRFDTDPIWLGTMLLAAHTLAALSGVLAGYLAARWGLINTMVFTHLPSNVLLMLIPLMPNQALAILVLLLRYSVSQMDVPTRQSYTLAVVSPQERSAAAGITGVARSLGAALSPSVTGMLLASPMLMSLPFFLAGGIKIVYDLLLFRSFLAVKPPEEQSN